LETILTVPKGYGDSLGNAQRALETFSAFKVNVYHVLGRDSLLCDDDKKTQSPGQESSPSGGVFFLDYIVATVLIPL
jgi:hypothetical protein